jgi:hypothetical protein
MKIFIISIVLSTKLSNYRNPYCLGGREENFKILSLAGFASSLTKLWFQRWLEGRWQCACKLMCDAIEPIMSPL